MPRPPVYDEKLRLGLITAAAAALAEGGVEGMSVRRVSAAAGTTTNAVYTLFGGKGGLVAAAAKEAGDSFTAAQYAVPVTDRPAWDIYQLGHAYRGWACANPFLYEVTFGGRLIPEGRPGGLPGVVDPVESAIQPLLRIVTSLVEDGTFTGAPPRVMSEVIWAGIHGWVTLETGLWRHRDPAVNDEGYQAWAVSTYRAWVTPGLDPDPFVPAT